MERLTGSQVFVGMLALIAALLLGAWAMDMPLDISMFLNAIKGAF